MTEPLKPSDVHYTEKLAKLSWMTGAGARIDARQFARNLPQGAAEFPADVNREAEQIKAPATPQKLLAEVLESRINVDTEEGAASVLDYVLILLKREGAKVLVVAKNDTLLASTESALLSAIDEGRLPEDTLERVKIVKADAPVSEEVAEPTPVATVETEKDTLFDD